MNSEKTKELKLHAANVRKMALEAVYSAGAGHPGGSMSIADILTYLYMEEMNVNPNNSKSPDRDRFVLSKGHCSPALYGVLAECGFIPKEDIKTFRHIDSYLQGHPEMNKVSGVDMSTGSLGQGISAACGMAKAAKKITRAIVYMRHLAMERARKGKSGRQRCLRHTMGLITLQFFWILMDFKSTERLPRL